MIALDTNLLVYAHLLHTPEHHLAQQAIERAVALNRCGIAYPSLCEFWSVVTTVRPGKTASSLQQAKSFIELLIQDGPLKIWYPTIGFHQRLMEAAQRFEVHGVKIFDLQIALLVLENKATEIWSHDRNFMVLPGLRVHDPLGA